MSLFFSYFADLLDSEAHRRSASLLLHGALNAMQQSHRKHGFETGTLGVCWAAEHVKKSVSIGSDDLVILEECESRMLAWIDTPNLPAALADGLAGVCAYAVERLRNSPDTILLRNSVNRLKDATEYTSHGAAWHITGVAKFELLKMYPGLDFTGPRYSMSVGYGAAGIVGALLAAFAVGIRDIGISDLIESAISWILAKRNGSDPARSFPVLVGAELPRISNGWYLGDLGVIMVLLNAAFIFGRDDWKNTVLDAAIHKLESPNRFHVHNFLHGSIGRAHFCNRVLHLTGDERFAEAAFRWYSLALGFEAPNGAVGGTMNTGQQFRGLFWGLSGLGLGLIGAVSNIEPSWDSAFFASHRPQSHET